MDETEPVLWFGEKESMQISTTTRAFDEFELEIGKCLRWNQKIKSSGEATRADLQVRDKTWDDSYRNAGAVLIWGIYKGEK